MQKLISIVLWLSCLCPVLGEGIIWPSNQLLPTFSQPAGTIDFIDVSSTSAAENNLFASLQGIVNRTQPRIAISGGDEEGKYTWMNIHNLPTNMITGYNAIIKYRSSVNGLVVTDPNQPDTLNLATTIAGVSNLLICDPILLPTLTNAPYSLPVRDDLRGRFSSNYQVYNYLYTNLWSQCTHRIIAGLNTNLSVGLRDYCVAVKSAVVWLNPANNNDKAVLSPYLNDMTAMNGIYLGWWPDEGAGLNWIAQYGIPVLASDFFRNASLFSGMTRPINVPEIPPPPPLQNKVYVAPILSDGDNIQYMQRLMKKDWDNPARGSVPIGWTVTPLAAELDPVMLNHYWNTATTNDCLISGPSGAGYAHIENWSAANVAAMVRVSDAYLQRSGLRVITIWDSVTTGVARAFATNCPTLLGLTDQSGGNYTRVDLGLRTVGLVSPYTSNTNDIISAITNAAKNWTGTSPMFLAAQAVVWNLGPADLRNIASALDPNKYVVVRPDHLFMLLDQLAGNPVAVTRRAAVADASTARLQGVVLPNAPAATAWFEWGTNNYYGFKTTATNVAGATLVQVAAVAGGLVPRTIYHYRVAASNSLGLAYGADQLFTTGGRVKAWGDDSFGQTNLPAGLTNVVAVSVGANHGLALKNNGGVAAWGDNNFKQTNVPAGLGNVVAVAAGVQHSLALGADGAVIAWGDDTYGQTNIPADLSNVVEVAAGGYHNLALKADGTVAAWGSDNMGQTNVPANLSNVVEIAAGRFHSLALKADGTIAAWGNNSSGQTNVPAGLGQVTAIAAGDYHSLALKADGISPASLLPISDWTADALSGASGMAVSNWVDSVYGSSAFQSSASHQPTLFTNVLNGHSVLRFSSAASQYLTVPAASSALSGASDFTLTVVFQTTTPGNISSSFFQNTGLVGGEQPDVVADWALCLNGSELGAGLGAGSGGCGADASLYGGNVTDGRAHIATYVRAGNSVRLYVDGVIVSSQTPICTAARGSYDFQIGTMTTGSGFFNGDIAEIQIYNRALTPAELTTLNAALAGIYGLSWVAGGPDARWVADNLSGSDGSSIGSWLDSIGSRSATQTSAVNRPRLYSNVINGHKVVRFSSGSSQYLTISATNSPISACGSFTLAVVFKTTTPGSLSGNFYLNTGLLSTEQPGVVPDWALCLNGSQLGAGLGSGSSGCGSDLSLYGGAVTDGNPHVALYVRSGGSIMLYVDGVIVAAQNSICPTARGDYPVQIGAMAPGLYYYNGDIAEIQMYDRALNARELMSLNENLAAAYNLGVAARPVVVWGSNSSGQTNVPNGLTQPLAAAAGSSFNLALQADGAVKGWGSNSSGQLDLVPGLTNVSALAAGQSFAIAIGNQTPQVSNLSAAGYVNHDLALTLPGSDPDENQLHFRVLSLPAAGTLYQSAGGARGTPINAPNALVTDPSGQVIFVAATNQTGNPYASFDFMAADDFYNSDPAQVTVNLSYPSAPQFSHVAWHSNDENFALNFSGSSNATYSVWASTNLLDWAKIGTASEASPGVYQFLDNSTTNLPQRFYRATAP